MAERALLATAGDVDYSVKVAHWGGTDAAVAAVCAGTPPDSLPAVEWQSTGTTPGFGTAVASLDFLTTATVYRVRETTTVFLSLWFGLPLATAMASPAVGALVAIDSLAEARRLRRQFRTLKNTLADALVAGYLPAPAVPSALRGAIAMLTGRERYLSVPCGAEHLSAETGPDVP